MFADVFECVLPTEALAFNQSVCDWRGVDGVASTGNDRQWPADSVPLVTASGPSLSAMGGIGGLRIGGQTSSASISEWNAQLPLLGESTAQVNLSSLTFNVSLQMSPYLGRACQSLEEVKASRYGLPLQQTLHEYELNDPQAPYSLGSDYVIAHWIIDLWERVPIASVSSVHLQSWSLADTQEQSTMFVTQAASSLNTTRPKHNFRLRRFGHGQSLNSYRHKWGDELISGGRSGESYLSDWITVAEIKCAPPDAPQFRRALGPGVTTLSMWDIFTNNVEREDTAAYGQAEVRCQAGYHWMPPQDSDVLWVFCSANGMWMSLDMTIPHCVENRQCSFPEVDRGFITCVQPAPSIISISVTDAPEFNVDNFTLNNVRYDPHQLVVLGQFFVFPVRVLVGGRVCLRPELWADAGQVENSSLVFGDQIRCSMPLVMGIRLPVTVFSGANVQLVETVNGALLTITTAVPIILSMTSKDCEPLNVSAQVFGLLQCPVDRPFNISVHLSADTVAHQQHDVSIIARLGSQQVPCIGSDSEEGELGPDSAVGVSCTVKPRLGEAIPFRVARREQAMLESIEDTFISFQYCPPGQKINPNAIFNSSAVMPCLPCPPGSSTVGASGALDCHPCLPGFVAPGWQQAECNACPIGKYVAEANASTCVECPVNSFTMEEGRAHCDFCDTNSYVQFNNASGNSSNSAIGVPICIACPAAAECSSTGNISASTGAYLVIDSASSSVATVACARTACQSVLPNDPRVRAECALIPPQMVPISGLRVINCCASGRLPAYDPTSPALQDTGGVNVLCATCQPDHSQVNGRCIACRGVQWPLVCVGVLLLLAVVFALHRLPHEWGGSATLSIITYFLQLSTLFLASESLPQLVTVVNLEVFGDHDSPGRAQLADAVFSSSSTTIYVGFCVLPMTALQKIQLRLLSPVVGLACVVIIAAVQAAFLFIAGVAGGGWEKFYRWLFIPKSAIFPPYTPAVERGAVDDLGVDSTQAQRRRVMLSYLRTCVRVVLTAYPSVSLTVVSCFRAVDVGEFGARLLDYPSVDPSNPSFRAIMPAVYILLVLYVLGLPVVLAAFLLVERRRVPGFSPGEQADGVDRNIVAEQLNFWPALQSQLFAMYKPQYRWYASFNLLRRLLVVVILGLVRDVSVWALLTMVNFVLLLLHLRIQPYVRPVDNRHETLALLSLALITALMAIVPPPNVNLALLLLILALLMLPLLPAAVTAFKEFIQRCRIRQQQRSHRLLPLQRALLEDEDKEAEARL